MPRMSGALSATHRDKSLERGDCQSDPAWNSPELVRSCPREYSGTSAKLSCCVNGYKGWGAVSVMQNGDNDLKGTVLDSMEDDVIAQACPSSYPRLAVQLVM